MCIPHQGSQFTSYEWQEFLEQHNLAPSMSRRGNCWDNAVVESFFNLLKPERVRRKKHKTREDARRDVFDYIEFFYNPQCKHVGSGMLTPIASEQQQKLKLQGVWETRGYSLSATGFPLHHRLSAFGEVGLDRTSETATEAVSANRCGCGGHFADKLFQEKDSGSGGSNSVRRGVEKKTARNRFPRLAP